MVTSVRVEDQAKYVEVIHQGAVTLEELEGARREAADQLARHGITRLLIDGRGADISAISDTDTFDFSAAHVSTFKELALLRIALVVHPDHAQLTRFAETVAQNRAVNLRIFFDASSARDWLAGAGV